MAGRRETDGRQEVRPRARRNRTESAGGAAGDLVRKFIVYSEDRLRRMRSRRTGVRAALAAGLIVTSTSCVRTARLALATPTPAAAGPLLVPAEVPLEQTALQPLSPAQAAAANAALPISGLPDQGAAPAMLRGVTAIDQLRSLDCLAQAVYYEARSESEDGQRAVAQVVLNRLHHAGYPASVCGVVYQGPMRAGGGCQFTFTCDGSLASVPASDAWLRARRIAADALAGAVFTPVGHATHYHTLSVFPVWAPTLVKSAVIGNHVFYRLPGSAGAAAAFAQRYAGREPLPVPGRILFARGDASSARPALQLAALDLPANGAQADAAGNVSSPPDNLPKVRLTERGLPESRVREQYSDAGAVRGETAAREPAPAQE